MIVSPAKQLANHGVVNTGNKPSVWQKVLAVIPIGMYIQMRKVTENEIKVKENVSRNVFIN